MQQAGLGIAKAAYDTPMVGKARTRRPSNLPTSREAAALLQLSKRDLFTPDAWQGMLKWVWQTACFLVRDLQVVVIAYVYLIMPMHAWQ